MTDLTTLANVKQWLGVTSSTDDAFLGRLISFASAFVQNYINRNVLTASYYETYDGSGGQTLMTPHYQITAVSSLTIDGVSIPAAANPQTIGYTFMAATGGSGDQLQMVFSRMSVAMEKALAGDGPQREAFAKMGIDLQFLQTHANDAQGVLYKLADGVICQHFF